MKKSTNKTTSTKTVIKTTKTKTKTQPQSTKKSKPSLAEVLYIGDGVAERKSASKKNKQKAKTSLKTKTSSSTSSYTRANGYIYKKVGTETFIVPKEVFETLKKNKQYISFVKKPNGRVLTVQITDANHRYIGTLKAYMGVSTFKNGTVTDFRKKNLVFAEKNV